MCGKDLRRSPHKIFPPICLPKQDQEFTGSATVYGWGQSNVIEYRREPAQTCSEWNNTYTFSQNPNFGKLHEVEVEIVDFEKCEKDLDFLVDSSKMICAGGEKKGACFGDSGGPLEQNGTLLGIVSRGDSMDSECDTFAERHDIYTKVAPFVDWIERIILENGGMEACGYVLENSFTDENDAGFQNDPSFNMVLLTGGSSESDILSSTQLLNINGTVDTCVPTGLPEPRKNHVTFVTKDTPPKLATCGGSTTWNGGNITQNNTRSANIDFFNSVYTFGNELVEVACCAQNSTKISVTCGRGISCAGQCSASEATLCPSGKCTGDPKDCQISMVELGYQQTPVAQPEKGTPITSPSFPSDYPNNYENLTTLEVSVGQRILIKFTDFVLEYSSSCRLDYVMIKDQDGTVLMDKSCSNLPNEIVSKTNRADVIFKTDASVTKRGWRLYFGPMPECIVYDPNTAKWNPGLRKLRKPRSHSSVVTSTKGVSSSMRGPPR